MWRGVRCTVSLGVPSARILARVLVARRSRRSFLLMFMALLLLPFLEGNDFVGVAHALALVGLGRADAADLGGRLADALPVGALDEDLGRARRLDADALRDRIADRVREAERQ